MDAKKEQEISELLDRLANYYAQRDVFGMQKQELIDQVISPEIRARLDEIEAEFAGKLEALEENINALDAQIRQEVIEQGASVRGSFLRVNWNKGRVSWDTKSLDDYARQHPEISAYRKQGEPFASIIKI